MHGSSKGPLFELNMTLFMWLIYLEVDLWWCLRNIDAVGYINGALVSTLGLREGNTTIHKLATSAISRDVFHCWSSAPDFLTWL